MNSEPRDIIVAVDGDTVDLSKEKYPWLKYIQVIVKGGDAGGGESGYVIVELYE